ncbi:helix-turn-helix transcriptional regulator [Sphingomonas sp. JC676]|uniref:helix-turn-helix domain-containing protein n=1 Tax=Sphingomonas sp. JC676 TaxID=2768065 RepID=UPI001658237B|nr:helix-turn-helix transcriptional regulator [Sphingomonas sp. JC676]MBC9033013.1 helix-turn-helix transcriptional regulator [Sphingomonas sp. JC676]
MPTAPTSELRRVFALRVREQRKRLHISQEELADRAQVHRTFIGAVERAETNVSIDNIARISAALVVEAWELLKE